MSLQALDRMRDPSSLRTRHNCPSRAATHSYNHRARVGYRSALIDTVVGNSGEWNLNDEAAAVRTQNQPLRVAAVPDRTFETWQHLAFHQDAAQNTARSDELQELRETSRRRVEHWPNTIEALRRNKEARRQRRLEEEEQRRCALDEAEAALVAAKRTEQLRHARTLLYETDDRVKTFLSNLRTAAVLEERTMQQDYAVRRKQAEKEREAQWFTAQEEARLRAEREDARNKTERHARALEFQAAQKAQLEEMKRQKISEIRANREEGRRIAAMAQSNAEKERQEERRRKEAALRNMDELMECNAQLQGLRQQERQKEQQEAEKIEAYAHQKQQQQQRRQERMAEKRRVQQATRQAMIDRQTEQLRIIQMEQRDAELKQMRDFEAERNADEQRKADHRAALWKDIVVSREEQLQRKQRQKERLQREAERMKGIWVVRTQDMLREEMHEREETQARAARIRQLQEWQHDEKSRRERVEADQVRHEAQIAAAVRAEEDALFGTYVRTVLEEFPPGSLAHTKGMRSLEGIR